MKIAMRFLLVAVALLGAGAVLAQAPMKAMKKATAAVGPDGIQRIAVVGGSYFYDPNYIIVKVNMPVEMKVRKESGMAPHNLVIKAPEAGIAIAVEMSTEAKTVTFTPTKVGTYPVYCDKSFLFFATHREKGMEGVLEVQPQDGKP